MMHRVRQIGLALILAVAAEPAATAGGALGSMEQGDLSDFIVEAPGFWTGSSCDADDCNLRSTEEVIYEVTILQDGTWTFSLCGSSYDTYLFVGTSICREEVGNNDDMCGLQSEMTTDLAAGTYYVTVEGFGGCGNYVLTITGSCICGDRICEPGCGEHCGTCSADCGPYDCPCDTTILTGCPNCNGFEAGFGDWRQSSCDDMDWTRHSGRTTTLGTGPIAAHGGSYYVYTEASGTGNPNKTAILDACFDLSALGDPTLDFWYHMLGFKMGTLRVDVSADGCGTWTEVWSLSGHQGFDWHEATVDLSAYAGLSITVRFVGITGDGVQSDMALDNICVQGTRVVCGDGFVCGAEICDDGNNLDCDGCRADCSAAETGCGDGFVCGIEECDDAGESSTCDVDCTAADCGDGVLNETAGEVCDKEEDAACGGQACRRSCRCAPPTCGNGRIDAGEACDGDLDDLCWLKGCRSDCTCELARPLTPTTDGVPLKGPEVDSLEEVDLTP